MILDLLAKKDAEVSRSNWLVKGKNELVIDNEL